MAEDVKKVATSTVLVIADRNDKTNEVLLTLIEENGVSLFRDNMGKGFLRGRVGKGADSEPNGTIVLSISKKDGSEVEFSTLYMNAGGEAKETGKAYGKFLAAGKASNIAFQKTPGTKEGVTFTNIVPSGKGNDGAEVTANIRGVDAEAILEMLPVYSAKPKAAPKP